MVFLIGDTVLTRFISMTSVTSRKTALVAENDSKGVSASSLSAFENPKDSDLALELFELIAFQCRVN